jgi:hypothetical protein
MDHISVVRDIKRVSMIFGLSGVPGYLDRLYLAWCREHGASASPVLRMRISALISLVASSIAFIACVAPT